MVSALSSTAALGSRDGVLAAAVPSSQAADANRGGSGVSAAWLEAISLRAVFALPEDRLLHRYRSETSASTRFTKEVRAADVATSSRATVGHDGPYSDEMMPFERLPRLPGRRQRVLLIITDLGRGKPTFRCVTEVEP